MKQNIPESSSSQHEKLRNSSTLSVDNLTPVPRKHLRKNKENDLISIKSFTNINNNLNNLINHENMDEITTTESPGKYSTICQQIENLQMDAEKLQTEITSLKQCVYNQQEVINR